VPKQATLSIRPAHRSIFGPAQSPNPIFTAPPHPQLPKLAWHSHSGQLRLASNPSHRPSPSQLLNWAYHIITSEDTLASLSLNKTRKAKATRPAATPHSDPEHQTPPSPTQQLQVPHPAPPTNPDITAAPAPSPSPPSPPPPTQAHPGPLGPAALHPEGGHHSAE
jgi:hypothetical protein